MAEIAEGDRRSVVVLVCGERLRGDDGAAPLAAEGLGAAELELAEIREVGHLSVEALLDVPEGVAIILADTAVGVAAGDVVIVPLSGLARPSSVAAPASSHSLPPDQVLALAEEMRGAPLRGVFVGIGGEAFGFGEGLSTPVAAGIPAYTAAIAEEIRRLAAGTGAEG
jgi:hydrogenase maturation protease